MRPDRLDPALLDRASSAAEEFLGCSTNSTHWEVVDRIDRPASRLFVLAMVAGGRRLATSYYKFHLPPRKLPGGSISTWRHQIQDRLIRAETLTARFNDLAGDLRIAMPPVLATDVAELAQMTLAVPGTDLGITLRRAVPGRRARSLRLYRMIGEAVRLIERCGDPAQAEGPDPPLQEPEALLAPLRRYLSSKDVDELGALLLARQEAVAHEQPPLVCAHADLSAENILVTSHAISIIDSAWFIRWPGYDLTKLTTRMRYQIPSSRSWTHRMTDALLEGYGDETRPSTASWRFQHLREVLRVAATSPSGSVKGRIRHTRGLRDVRAILREVGP